ncbi:MAG TPA: hypothetical protein VLW50_15200 [Streptosporangiaceae bacterium]|nr:hypothetical protein [Streptosporangiaceae bacterium]
MLTNQDTHREPNSTRWPSGRRPTAITPVTAGSPPDAYSPERTEQWEPSAQTRSMSLSGAAVTDAPPEVGQPSASGQF